MPFFDSLQANAYKIVFQADPPDPRRIPPNDLLGVTVLFNLLSPSPPLSLHMYFAHDGLFLKMPSGNTPQLLLQG